MISALPALFALTLFVAAFLLFSVQPMIARLVLPLFGGSPAVWTTCMLFFQVALLAGYIYAHVSTTRLDLRRQVAVHLAVLALAFLFLPIALSPGAVASLTSPDAPTAGLLGWLTRSAGVPVFAIATTAPLLQRWFSATRHPSARDPYYLSVASNAGSLLALVLYPLWFERRLRLLEQSTLWSAGLAVLGVLVLGCGIVALVQERGGTVPARINESIDTTAAVEPAAWFGWLILALIPSSAMLGVTTYLSTDLAPIPLLWVIPLALYLLSFIIVFSRRSRAFVDLSARALPLLIMVQAPVMAAGMVQPFWIPLHLVTFFLAAMVCHGELARLRPPVQRLTSFYLAIALGGALGGVFNAVVAPVVFDRIAEYPLALVAACFVLAFRGDSAGRSKLSPRMLILPAVIAALSAPLCANVGGIADSALGMLGTMIAAGLTVLVAATHRRQPARFAATVGVLFLASGFAAGVSGRVIHRERSFFGALKVTEIGRTNIHRLFHGSTLHGQQALDPARRREPLTYFSRSGPIGQVFEVFDKTPGREHAALAFIGLGTGSLACYAQPGQRWTFYEIDRAVVRIARDPRYFTYLSDCRAASLDVVVGDARLSMARAPDRQFDLIVLDAFCSDAIPIHLLTREALALDLRKLRAGGLIAMNISNAYLDLAPVIALLARDAGLAARVRIDNQLTPAEKEAGKQGSIWALLANGDADLGPIADDPRWLVPHPLPGDVVWTDDYSNILDHLRLRSRPSIEPSRAVHD